MASSSKMLVVLAALALLASAALATDYVVGDADGWALNKVDYAKWASDKTFYVGDKLVFNYNNTAHNVLSVDGAAFKNCSKPVGAKKWDSGKDEIVLAAPGKHWYICGFGEHCNNGMKLVVNVQGSFGAPAPAPNSATTVVAAPMLFGSIAAAVALLGMALL